jgi:hypothetical protein
LGVSTIIERGEDEKEKYGVRFVRSLKNDGGWSALGVEFQLRCGVHWVVSLRNDLEMMDSPYI